MTPREYRLLTLKDMQTRRWKTAYPLETRGGATIAKGREVAIVAKHKGLTLRAPKCIVCGQAFRVVKIEPGCVEEFDGCDVEADVRDRVVQLEEAIRRHRDERGDDRCVEDDYRLYRVLGEEIPEHACQLVEPAEMLRLCREFIRRRHDGDKPYISPQREIDRLRALLEAVAEGFDEAEGLSRSPALAEVAKEFGKFRRLV